MEATKAPSDERMARSIQVLAVALSASVLIYMAVAWFVVPTMTPTLDDPQQFLLMAGILAVISFGNLVAAQMLFAARLRAAEQLPTPEQRLESYRVAVILAFALRESIAIFGLVLSFLSGDIRWCFGFGAIALVSMLMGWPKPSTAERLASEVPPIG